MADIEAKFHQVRVRPSDCDALRLLWWPDGNLGNPPEKHEMRVNLFGGASSPSCANFALKKTAKDSEADFEPQVVETVERNFYVDDCLKSVSEEYEAVKLAKQLREILARGGFKLTKWLSRERRCPMEYIVRSIRIQDRRKGELRPATRRGILSIVNSVYDPLGFSAPFIFQAKLIL